MSTFDDWKTRAPDDDRPLATRDDELSDDPADGPFLGCDACGGNVLSGAAIQCHECDGNFCSPTCEAGFHEYAAQHAIDAIRQLARAHDELRVLRARLVEYERALGKPEDDIPW